MSGNQQPGLVGLFNGFRARSPQLYVDVVRTKVKTMGVQLTDVFDALQAYLGSYYVKRLQPLLRRRYGLFAAGFLGHCRLPDLNHSFPVLI